MVQTAESRRFAAQSHWREREKRRARARFWFWVACVALMLAVMALSGCYASREEIEAATDLCAPHGGIDYVWPTLDGVRAGCADTTVVSRRFP